MRITPAGINGVATITRQTLYDMWANGAPSTIEESDLDAGTLPIAVQGSAPTAAPGKIWYDDIEDVVYYFADEFDDTGVSLWLAWGPDQFEVPMLAAHPVPPGAGVTFSQTLGGKWARLVGGMGHLPTEARRLLGFNNQADTAASGTWFRAGVFGRVRVWHWRGNSADVGVYDTFNGQEFARPASDVSAPTGALWVNSLTITNADGPLCGTPHRAPVSESLTVWGYFTGMSTGSRRQLV